MLSFDPMDLSTAAADTTEQLGTEVASVQRYAPLDTALTAQMQELKQAGCTVVAFGGAVNNTPAMVAAATQLDFKPQWIAEFIARMESTKVLSSRRPIPGSTDVLKAK